VRSFSNITDDVHGKVRLLAQAWETDDNGAIRRLLEAFQRAADEGSEASVSENEVEVHVIFEKVRTDALYDRSTRSITITSGPLAGQSFGTPSGAASAVIKEYRPDVSPSRNGWSFWTISADGRLLQSIR
jgi:hypothetical protein